VVATGEAEALRSRGRIAYPLIRDTEKSTVPPDEKRKDVLPPPGLKKWLRILIPGVQHSTRLHRASFTVANMPTPPSWGATTLPKSTPQLRNPRQAATHI